MIGSFDGYEDPDLYDLPEDDIPMAGDLDMTWPTLTMIGGRPYGGSVLDGGTYIIKRQGNMILTPEGWFDIDEFS